MIKAMRHQLWLLTWVLLSASLPLSAHAVMRYVDGVHYEIVPTDKRPGLPSGTVVLEFFSYGCPHCRSIAEPVKQWAGQRSEWQLIKVPVVWNKPFQVLGRLHYALAVEGLVEQHGLDVFRYLHDNGQRIRNRQDVEAFVATLPVDGSAVMAAFDDAAREADLRGADALARQIGIAGVPAFIVNGLYQVSLRTAGSPETLFQIIDFLVAYGPLNAGQ